MSNLHKSFIALLILTLLFEFAFIYMQKRHSTAVQQQHIVNKYIISLRLAEAEFNRQIVALDSRFFLNYDAVNLAFKNYIKQVENPPELPKELESELKLLSALVNEKFSLVENIKSSHSIYRNTSHYLPSLLLESHQLVTSLAVSNVITLEQEETFHMYFQAASSWLVLMISSPQEAIKPPLIEISENVPEELHQKVHQLEIHSNLMGEHIKKTQQYQAALKEIKIESQLRVLSEWFSTELQRSEQQRKEQTRLLIASLIAVIAIILVYIVIVLAYRRKDKVQQTQLNTDPLTGLGNRHLLEQELPNYKLSADSDNQPFCLMFIDLDGFKAVNDNYGHNTGDALLQFYAKALPKLLKEGDLLVRLGGDEFVIVVNNDSYKRTESLATEVLKVFNQKFTEKGVEVKISASIGISSYPDHASTMQKLIEKADFAMYQAKQQGKNRICIFNESTERRADIL